MATKYLIDTSAVIKYLNQTFPANGIGFIDSFIDTACTISFISEIELQAWKPNDPNDIIVYQQFILQCAIIGISKGIVSESITIRKVYNLKIADAIIAATAVEFDLTLVADNDNDFGKVPYLKYVNPRKI